MDKFLRFFIKFHGYCIAIAGIGASVYFTLIDLNGDLTTSEKLIYLRFTGVPAVVFGLVWTIVSSLLVVGVFKEKKPLLYPFPILFGIDLVLLLVRDIHILMNRPPWYIVVFLAIFIPCLFIIPYVILTMAALIRLFNIDPIVQAESNFVRLDRNPSDEVNLKSVVIDK